MNKVWQWGAAFALSSVVMLMSSAGADESSPGANAQAFDTAPAAQIAQKQPQTGKEMIEQANETFDRVDARLQAENSASSADPAVDTTTPSTVNFSLARNKTLTSDGDFENYIDPRITGKIRAEALAYMKAMNPSKRGNVMFYDNDRKVVSNSWEIWRSYSNGQSEVNGPIKDAERRW